MFIVFSGAYFLTIKTNRMQENINKGSDESTMYDLVLRRIGVTGVGIKIGDGPEKVIKNPVELSNLADWLKAHSKFMYEMQMMYKQYGGDYHKTVDDFLNTRDELAGSDDDVPHGEYPCGGNYAMFLGTCDEEGNSDNIAAGDRLKKEYSGVDGNFTYDLDFEPQQDFCFIYAKSKAAARHFMIWVRDKYIIKFLDVMADEDYDPESGLLEKIQAGQV